MGKVGYKELVKAAEERIKAVSAAEAIDMLGSKDVVFVDLRDVRELRREGGIPGAFHCPRGLLEFWIDPESPYYKDFFGGDGPFIFMCAGGLRSALTTQLAQRMGLKPVYNLIGGFGAWKKAEAPIEPVEKTW